MIKVEHLTKNYAGLTAVNDISFEVAQHEVLGFLGPNGAGKSTTLRILTGYLSATAGKVTVGGYDVFSKPEAVKQLIGYLPENVPLYPEMRVYEFLRYRAGIKRVPGSKKKAAVDGAIERCQIGDVQNRIVGQLSKGYRQRVGLADALVGDPKILILDEPTIGLDPNQIRQVRGLVRELGKERTVILSSHILPEVEAVCSRVQIIHKGHIVGGGKPDELRSNLADGGVTISVEVRDPEGKAEAALKDVDGIKSVGDPKPTQDGFLCLTVQAEDNLPVRERIFDLAVKTGFKLVGIETKSLSLEDIFVEITTREEAAETAPAKTKEKGGEK